MLHAVSGSAKSIHHQFDVLADVNETASIVLEAKQNADRYVGFQHLIDKELTGFRKLPRIIGLKILFNQLCNSRVSSYWRWVNIRILPLKSIKNQDFTVP
jgi:hypothetical protein